MLRFMGFGASDLPEWFRAPRGSLLRESIGSWGWIPWIEDRSMQAPRRTWSITTWIAAGRAV